ncbi:MAG: serpin [Thermomicrobiales bacterium]|jgi:serpin B|nr:serpin [Thermomicrobiales bacterium]
MRRKTWVLLALILCVPMSAGAFAQEDGASELVAGNTAFALDLYAAVRQDADGNLLFSPYSISQALAMTYAGAGGETAAQMADALSFRLPQPALHEAFSALNADLVARGTAEDDPDESQTARALRSANALWGEQTYPFSPSYDAQIERYYGAGLQPSDFINAPEETRGHINDWVAEQTEDRIQNIVPEGAITPDTRLVLANAIWFYGGWRDTFTSGATTRDGEFFLLDGTTVAVPFMFQRVHLPYARGNGFQAIEFPYADSEFSFTVILPDEGRFAAFEEGLDTDKLSAAIGQLSYTDVLVYLPKFEFEFSAGLAQTLQSMGMADAFDPMRADFTGMVEGTPSEPLFIGEVLHKAFISVDENGTEAAAATVGLVVTGGPGPEEEPTEVRVDRPFIFAIRDTQTGTVLFMGRVTNPSA